MSDFGEHVMIQTLSEIDGKWYVYEVSPGYNVIGEMRKGVMLLRDNPLPSGVTMSISLSPAATEKLGDDIKGLLPDGEHKVARFMGLGVFTSVSQTNPVEFVEKRDDC
jgi:hypothetical protein